MSIQVSRRKRVDRRTGANIEMDLDRERRRMRNRELRHLSLGHEYGVRGARSRCSPPNRSAGVFMKLRLLLAMALLLVLGCGNPDGFVDTPSPPTSTATTKPMSAGEDPPHKQGLPVDWDNPIKGQEVSSFEQTKSLLPFAPYDPKNLGQAIGLFVSNGAQMKSRVLGLVYDTPEYGRVVVIEELLHVPMSDYQAGMKQIVDSSAAQSELAGQSELVAIRGGLTALVTATEDGRVADIRWTDGTIVFLVRGPSLVRDMAVQVAEAL